MPKAHIRLAFRQLIDPTTSSPFEQQVFRATWSEFCVQQQSFSKGRPLFTWAEIKDTFPKSNPALPFKVSFSIAGIINSLNNQIPGLHDTLGIHTIPFLQHRFELIRSDVNDASQHQVSITWISPELALYEVIGDQLLLALDPPQTFLLKMQPGLSIITYVPAAQTQPQLPAQSVQNPSPHDAVTSHNITSPHDAPTSHNITSPHDGTAPRLISSL